MAILGIMANLDGENGENCHMADDSNWMPKVTSWRVAILENFGETGKKIWQK